MDFYTLDPRLTYCLEWNNPDILGLLNSKLLFQYLLSIGTFLRGGYIRFWTQYIQQIPIKFIDFSIASEKAKHDRIVSLVEQMLSLHKRLTDAKMASDKKTIEQQIKVTDHQIDHLVYELYELTPEEIAIVEDEWKKSVLVTTPN